MIDGYDSTFTLTAALRNVLLVWTLPGLANVALGALLLSRSALVGGEEGDRWLGAVQAGMLLLWVITTIVAILWAVRTWGNIRHVGKLARIGLWKILRRHVWFFVASIFFAVGAAVNPTNGRVFLAFALLTSAIAGAFIPALILETVRLFWRTGSPVNGGLVEELPHYGMLWFASFVVYSSTNSAYTFPLTAANRSLLTMVSGGCCIIAAVTGAKLVTDISRRHDRRLEMIISQAEPDDQRDRSITSHQIESAWADSESLVRFDLP